MMNYEKKDYAPAEQHFAAAAAPRSDRPEIWYYVEVPRHKMGNDTQGAKDMELPEELFPPNDKRRRDAKDWLKELDKGPSKPPPSTAPPLTSGSRPQLKPGEPRQP